MLKIGSRKMASIFKRPLKNGTVMWRLMFRRKGIKPFITSFSTEEEAQKFATLYEEKYVLDPDNFTFDQLKQLRINEFYRKNNSGKKKG
jgi:hypothetical protein